MRIALITTTIYVPKVLELYRSFNKDVSIFVAGDKKTPHTDTRKFVEGLGNSIYYSDSDQEKLGYASSALIGWNKIMRRNIALLEAIRSKSDIIISIDDDNLPVDKNYFSDIAAILSKPFDGLKANSKSHWFNVGQFLGTKIYHRGFPYSHRHTDLGIQLSAVRNGKVGVAAGLWLGDPDIDAMERITNRPTVYDISDTLRAGLAIDTSCLTPFNSQNTAYLAELAPLMMVLISVGRYDDIWASYIAQRVMSEYGYMVHFGKPLVWQERNQQNLWVNLRDELYGMENTEQFCQDLVQCNLSSGQSVLDKLNILYEQLQGKPYLSPAVYEMGKVWCKDVALALSKK